MRVFILTNRDVRVPMPCAIDDGVRLRRAEIIETDMVTPTGLAKGKNGLTVLLRAQGSLRHACAEASGAC